MRIKNILTGKRQHVPSKNEIKEIKRKKTLEKRREKKREKLEAAEEKRRQAKINKRTGRDKFVSNDSLQKASADILKQAMKEWQIPLGKDILNGIIGARIGKRLSRERRADKRKNLAIGAAVFHQIAAHPNPKKILHKLAESVGVNIDRISDPCRIITECLIDYGTSKEEKLANRQYAASDARALKYIIRTGMTPQEVMKPAKGESVTVWAKREAEYRSGKRAAVKPAKKAPEKEVLTEPLSGQLATLPLTQAAYNAIMRVADQGVVVVTPRGGGEALALAAAPLKRLTTEDAIKEPGKVRKAIRKALIKSRQKITGSAENNSDW